MVSRTIAIWRSRHGDPRSPPSPASSSPAPAPSPSRTPTRGARTVRYRRPDDTYDREALDRLAKLFRSRGDGAVHDPVLRLVEILSHVQDLAGAEHLVLLSGYRSPDYNQTLKGAARASMHTEGLAADIGLAKPRSCPSRPSGTACARSSAAAPATTAATPTCTSTSAARASGRRPRHAWTRTSPAGTPAFSPAPSTTAMRRASASS